MRGIVQGVGFRPWVFRLAHAHGLDRARVEPRARRDDRGLRPVGVDSRPSGGPRARRAARRDDRRTSSESPLPLTTHRATSRSTRASPPTDAEVSIPPDLATCRECLAEVAEPGARRHRYAFTNCTNCGPRFTIALDVPYDRRLDDDGGVRDVRRVPRRVRVTARPSFPRAANRVPGVRAARCVSVGPTGDADDTVDPFERAARVAPRRAASSPSRGSAGYLLACDATSGGRGRAAAPAQAARGEAVRRDGGDAGATRSRWPAWTTAERALLTSAEAPIVLCESRTDSRLAPEVAPRTPLVGLFLAYTPLHRLLLEAAGRPLVMTSGNLSEEPLAYRDEEALERLAGLADAWLMHDREIAAPCDDSVVRVVAGAPMVMRRARGYVPRAGRISPRPCARPVLGCGALLKNTFCLARRRPRLARPARRRPRQPGDDDVLRAGGRAARALHAHDAGGVRPRPPPGPALDALRAARARATRPCRSSTTTRTSPR